MCKTGDIILVKNPTRDGKPIGRHSFIVLSTEEGEIEGMAFDLVTNVMSSIDGKGENYKKRKLSYPDNIPFDKNDVRVPGGNKKEGFIKAGVLFYFKKESIDFEVIGGISIDLYQRILDFIQNYDGDIVEVIDNLS